MSARRQDEIGRRPSAGCSITAWMVAGTSTVRVGRSRAIASSVASGVKRGMQRHGRAELQRRRGLDVEPADMEQRQHGEHVIVRRHVVHVLAHHGVPHQRLLAQHRALRAAGRARGVDDQQRAGEIDVRVAAVAAAGREQIVEAMPRRRKSRPTMRTSGSACFSGATTAAKPCSTHQRLHRRIGQDEHLLRHREPPVERHQHRAEPRAGIEQHQIVGMIER